MPAVGTCLRHQQFVDRGYPAIIFGNRFLDGQALDCHVLEVRSHVQRGLVALLVVRLDVRLALFSRFQHHVLILVDGVGHTAGQKLKFCDQGVHVRARHGASTVLNIPKQRCHWNGLMAAWTR